MHSGWRKRKRGTKKVPTISVDQSFSRKGTKRNSDDVTCEDVEEFLEKLNVAVEEELRIFQENGVNVLNADGTTKRPLSVYEQGFVIAAGRIKRSLRS